MNDKNIAPTSNSCRPRKPDVQFGVAIGVGSGIGTFIWQLVLAVIAHSSVNLAAILFNGVFVGVFMYALRRLRPHWLGIK